MTKMEKAIYDKLNRLFKEAHFAGITITMKSTGIKMALIPCAQTDHINDLSEVEWILVYGDQDANTFGGTVEDTCKQLADYDTRHQKWIDETKKIQEYFDKYLKDSDRNDAEWQEHWGWYSDWHKDLFGYRPRYTA